MKRTARPSRIFWGWCPWRWSLGLSWDRPFSQPVRLPNGRPASTPREAADYIKTLPKSVRDRNDWRLAVHMLIEAAEDQRPMTFARIAVLRAIERDAERGPPTIEVTDRKRRRLTRDR
jgi:hypothetical protein